MGSTARSEFRTVSKRARTLLDRTEGLESDFKQTPNAVESSDIVAFANSARGGTILVGVEETQDAQGIQRGRVIGCDVTDQTKQRILNRAASCVPPVPVQIYVENTSKTPFLRIDIPTSARRPHSTSSGKYKVRDDGITRALLPGELLVMFLEAEEASFIGRFRAATEGLSITLETLRESTRRETDRLLDTISDLSRSTREQLEEVGSSAADAHAFSEEAHYASETTLDRLDKLSDQLNSHDRALRGTDNALILIGEALGVDIEVPRVKAQVQFVCRFPFLASPQEMYEDLRETCQPVKDGRITLEMVEQWCQEALATRGGSKDAAG